jgi:hypothetical protein
MVPCWVDPCVAYLIHTGLMPEVSRRLDVPLSTVGRAPPTRLAQARWPRKRSGLNGAKANEILSRPLRRGKHEGVEGGSWRAKALHRTKPGRRYQGRAAALRLCWQMTKLANPNLGPVAGGV